MYDNFYKNKTLFTLEIQEDYQYSWTEISTEIPTNEEEVKEFKESFKIDKLLKIWGHMNKPVNTLIPKRIVFDNVITTNCKNCHNCHITHNKIEINGLPSFMEEYIYCSVLHPHPYEDYEDPKGLMIYKCYFNGKKCMFHPEANPIKLGYEIK